MKAAGSSFLYWYTCKNKLEPGELADHKYEHHTQHSCDVKTELTADLNHNIKQSPINRCQNAIAKIILKIFVRLGLIRYVDD